MVFSFLLTSLLIWTTQDLVSCEDLKPPHEVHLVPLGGSLTLNCTYKCSSGFVRGCWSKTLDNLACLGTITQRRLCTVSLRLRNISAEDVRYNYSCYTVATDHLELKNKPELFVSLKAQESIPNGAYTVTPTVKNASVPAKPGDAGEGEATGIQVIASVTVAMALLLAATALYLCLTRSRHGWNGEPVLSCSSSLSQSHAVFSPVKGSLSNDRVTVRIPSPEDESDVEVPYADIMITVRGVSTPELTQVSYLSPGDQNEWRRDEPRPHLQASRSADRLFVPQPREVSRKMSTNSEYAVITYA